VNETQEATPDTPADPPAPRPSRTVRHVTAGGQMRPLLVGAAVVVALVVIIVVAGRYDRAGQRDAQAPAVAPGRIQVEGAPAAPADGPATPGAAADQAPPTPVQFYQVLTQGRESAPVGGGEIEMRAMPLPPPPDDEAPARAPAARAAEAPVPQAAPAKPTAPEAAPRAADTAPQEADSETASAADAEAPAPSAASGTAKAAGALPYSLQVGSFSQRDGADELVQRLDDRGFEAYLVEVDLKGKGTWWRVRVGRYHTEYAAKWARLELVKEGLSPIVVRDRTPR
jgi:cell division protein FtsN